MYYRNHQRSKRNDELSSISIKDIAILLSHWKIIVYKQNYQTKCTRLCYIRTHNDGITNKLLQKQKLKYRSIVHEEDTNVCTVTYRRLMYTFQNVVFETQELYTNRTTKDHPVTKSRECIYRFERSSQEYDQMAGY